MPELRQDPVTLKWVTIAVERAKRPHTFTQAPKVVVKATGECPFCYGHEGETPPEVMAYRDPGTGPNTAGWSVRVVPNLYPAFGPASGDLNPRHVGPYTVMNGLGAHEVLISSPEHYKDLALLPQDQVTLILKSYIDRYLVHRNNPVLKYVLIIVNHGKEAGASREHPHAQLFGIPIVPHTVVEEIEGLQRYKTEKGTCAYCDVLAYEMKVGERIVYENDKFVVFAPYASKVPFETWLMPKSHGAHFEAMSDQEVRACGDALRTGLAKLHYGLNDPPFNFYIHTAPYSGEGNGLYHWHIEILPKLSIWAGFELGSGIMINTALPESAAEFLRKVPLEEPSPAQATAVT
ncbi:MAG: galactose-1-phosphate uridylyltransferase [Chloroflexi bacterium]|nr:galactose-1-phosphate uridylyltransferase [Chloroflexota bacterium]